MRGAASTKGKRSTQARAKTSEATPLVIRFASKIAAAANGAPILDVACGSGRNAILLAELGCRVICIDLDLSKLKARMESEDITSGLDPYHLDLINDAWPFKANSVGGILNVHFLLPSLFPCFESSLMRGGYLLLETPPGCGNNYLELLPAGMVKSALETGFDIEFYRENKVGPATSDAATVKLLAKRC